MEELSLTGERIKSLPSRRLFERISMETTRKGKIIVAGIGPGDAADLTPAVRDAIRESDVVIGYKYYFQFISNYMRPDARREDTGMRRERERATRAFELAEAGETVCVISSGDPGIYGMAPLVLEMGRERGSEVEIVVLPGISAFQKAAAKLGAPMGHDFCVISLSDLMTPWERIERRIIAAAMGDFVTAIYNPKSEGRYWQLYRLKELFLKERAPETPVGFVRQAGRTEEAVEVTTLADFDPERVDMFTVVLIGNSRTFLDGKKMVTPRGYYNKEEDADEKLGQAIMIRSFQTIERELRQPDIPLDRKWALLHAIHTTADFEMESLLWADEGAVAEMYRRLCSGETRTIVTDVTMAAAGIRKGALARLGVEVKCYLSDERVADLAVSQRVTRTQAGIRLAVAEHPDALFVFGNAPTALMELCALMRRGQARPAGIIAAPVGFVHVQESKHQVKVFQGVPKLIIEGRKGGSNLAATLVNAVLCFDDAEQLKPGRDV